MNFFQPLKPFIVNQYFGENKVCVNDDLKILNCDGKNPPTGYRSLYGEKGHTGLDLLAARGQEIYCAQRGTVKFIDTNPKSGLDVRIESVINGEVYLHIYEHLLGYVHPVGTFVETGEILGWADNTGYSSGDHLHFEIRKNGEAFDPIPLLADAFAKDILAINHTLKYLTEQIALLADRIGDYLRRK